jgi:hypothetical protein
MKTNKIWALFFAGFFAKDLIDNIFFLQLNLYPIEIMGFSITARSHQIMLAVSLILTSSLLYYSLKKMKK